MLVNCQNTITTLTFTSAT